MYVCRKWVVFLQNHQLQNLWLLWQLPFWAKCRSLPLSRLFSGIRNVFWADFIHLTAVPHLSTLTWFSPSAWKPQGERSLSVAHERVPHPQSAAHPTDQDIFSVSTGKPAFHRQQPNDCLWAEWLAPSKVKGVRVGVAGVSGRCFGILLLSLLQ